jgi:predicted DCC family thiol-disulfide oxidoreductase YuxK
MKNGWTGGQYSIVRAIFGIYLFVHFLELIPWAGELFSNQGLLADGWSSPLLHLFPNVLALWDSPGLVTAMVSAGAVLSLLFAVGCWDRVAALLLWYLWACLHGRMPLISNPSLPYVGWMLLAHVFLPVAPYGSWSARGRADPGNGWQMPPGIFLVAWILMALGYTYSGYTKLISPSWLDGTAMARVLENPLARPSFVRDALLSMPAPLLRLATRGALLAELSFAPLALVGRLRPWIWGLMLLMHLNLIVLIDFADLSIGMIMMHLFTFDPAWIPPRPAAATAFIFYDGHCGLCHRGVRFVLAEDRTLTAFRFAPLQSEALEKAIPKEARALLPDSLVVVTAKGEILTRSRAVRYILQGLGGLWRLLGILAAAVPCAVLDLIYDRVASIRLRLFARPTETCPLLPKHLRERFAA